MVMANPVVEESTRTAYSENALVFPPKPEIVTPDSRPLFDIRNTKMLRQHTTSKVHLNTGPRGAGKSLLMVRMISLSLIICVWINKLFESYIGTKAFMRPLQVWSNLPISFLYQPSQDGAIWPGAEKVLLLSTLPLDMHKLYVFDENMRWGKIYIDELDQNADRQDWQNGGQKLFMKILIQIRKLHLSLTATIQSLGWVNPRLMFQVDTDTLCRDAAVTAWGMANNLDNGTMTFLYTHDRSGAETGYTYDESGRTYEAQLFGLPLHSLYDTDFIQDPWKNYESIKINRKQLVLDPHGAEEVQSYENDLEILQDTLRQCVAEKKVKLLRSEFFNMAQAAGLRMNKTEAGQYLVDVHNVKIGAKMGAFYLDLSEVKYLDKVAKRKQVEKDAE